MSSGRALTSFGLLSFDCFGTIVDWDSGIWDALQPLVTKLPLSSELRANRNAALGNASKLEEKLKAEHPAMLYDELLATVYRLLAEEQGVQVSPGEADKFAQSLATWSAFPDSIEALNRLQKHFKLVILSNVDNASFSRVLTGPLADVKFDAVYTAQDIGSYKPDLNNFRYLIKHCKDELNIGHDHILHVAHGLGSDHVPAKEIGLESIWIARADPLSDGSKKFGERVAFREAYHTLGELADAVDRDAAGA